MDVLLTIGELSKMTYLSVKALRHYHDVGLLVPVEVDPGSGYRRYGASQVATAQAIRRFRELDMPIDDVRQVLAAPDGEERNRVIVEHLGRLQAQLARTQASVASLQELLTGDPRPPADVELRHLAATPALAVRRVVSQEDCAPWLEVALADLQDRAAALDLVVVGPEGACWPDEFFEEDAGEVVAFVPLAAAPRGWARDELTEGASGALELVDLPATNVAVLAHRGSWADADQTYGALGTVVAERAIGGEGPIRELYVADDHIDVCWPVTVGRT